MRLGRRGRRELTYKSSVSYGDGEWYLFLIEGVVEGESMVLDIFGDAIYLVLGLMNLDLRISA